MSSVINDPRLGPMKKSDLQFSYPASRPASDDPSKRGVPDSSLLNREEWYEMLYFCNKFAIANGDGRLAVALKAERLIKKHLPGSQRSHVHVTAWLLQNWALYQ